MSISKPVKEAVVLRTDEKGPGKKSNFSLRTKPNELPEIKHNSWLDWDDMVLALNEFLQCNFQDLESIMPDSMRLLDIAGYIQYTKILRTQNLLQSQQGDSTRSLLLKTLSTNVEQHKTDFGSPANSELVSVHEIHCFLMLTAIPSNGLPINNLLAATPSARFTDSTALATTLLNWEKSSALLHLSDFLSTRASAYIAATPSIPKSGTTPPSTNPPLTTFCVHCHKKYPKKPKTNTHTSLSCGLNPANRPANPNSNFSAMRALLAQAEASTPRSPTSSDILVQLTGSAFEESLKTSA
jgi:hypothetical protein